MRTMNKALGLLLALAMIVAFGSLGCDKGDKAAADKPAAEKPAEAAKPATDKPAEAAKPAEKPAEAAKAPERKTGKTDEKVKLEFYVMSKCPFGTKVLDAIIPVIKEMGANMDFSVNFIADVQADGGFKSLHGQPEVDGDIVMLCGAKHAPDKVWDFIGCMNKNMRDIPNNWEKCATDNGLDMAKMKACYEGEEGKQLLKDSIALSKKRMARGSPTIFLADKKYSGGRSSTSFKRGICGAFKGVQPEACASLPAPVPVTVTVLTDARCKECRTAPMVSRLKGMFEGLTVKQLDYGTDEGKKLYKDLGVKLLPVFLFAKDVEKSEGYAQLKRYMVPQGEYLSLRVGAKFDPTAEICDNGQDDTGNGKVDCDDDTCAGKMVCRKEEAKRLDLYVMSQCPYGVKALNAMEEVIKAFEGEISFHVHYIATDLGGGKFKALHGQPEVDENIREMCAIKYYPKDFKYMDYILCRNKNIRSTDWQSCTGGDTGIDTAVIQKCFEGEEGKQLASASAAEVSAAGFSASPTWLANNKFKFSGITAEQIKQNFCRHNPGLKGCDKKLSDEKVKGGACK